MSGDYQVEGHAFISYARVDLKAADDLHRILRAAGIRVWRDTSDLWPGQDWRSRIRQAIDDEALAFIACFSSQSVGRVKAYQNEELVLAIEQLRQRRPEDPWLIPVRFDDCAIPPMPIGAGRTLESIQAVDLFGDRWDEGMARLVAVTVRLLSQSLPEAANPASPGPAVTDRWRLTRTAGDVPSLTQLGSFGFDHDAYSRPVERTPPWVRFRAVVACERLDESAGWQELRSRFTDFLMDGLLMSLTAGLTEIGSDARWRPRGTYRRSYLEADLTTEVEALTPMASASLTLPESQIQAGVRAGTAQLTLHTDFIRRTPISISEQIMFKRPRYWRSLFAQALELPGMLVRWLKADLNLPTSDSPPAEFGIMLHDIAPLTNMIDIRGIPVLSSPAVQNQFTGWAVADANGQTASMLASAMMRDLSERVLHLNGTIEEMEGRV